MGAPLGAGVGAVVGAAVGPAVGAVVGAGILLLTLPPRRRCEANPASSRCEATVVSEAIFTDGARLMRIGHFITCGGILPSRGGMHTLCWALHRFDRLSFLCSVCIEAIFTDRARLMRLGNISTPADAFGLCCSCGGPFGRELALARVIRCRRFFACILRIFNFRVCLP